MMTIKDLFLLFWDFIEFECLSYKKEYSEEEQDRMFRYFTFWANNQDLITEDGEFLLRDFFLNYQPNPFKND